MLMRLQFRMAFPCGAVMRAWVDWQLARSLERDGVSPVFWSRYQMRRMHKASQCRACWIDDARAPAVAL